MVDHYKSLGLTSSASQDEIKKAYRTLAKQYHPDVNPGNEKSEQMFETIAEAYAVLSDETKKAKYDQNYANSSDFPSKTKEKSSNQRYSSNMSEEDIFKASNVAFEDFFGFNPNDNKTTMGNGEKVKPVKTKDMFRAIFGDDIRF